MATPRAEIRFRKVLEPALRAAMDASAAFTPDDFLARAGLWRSGLAAGTPVTAALPDVFALLAGAAREHLGYAPHPVQLQAATLLTDRTVVEMQTGEGKTLTAAFSLALFGLTGKGAWLVTANDYLAQRDADHLRPLFAKLGLSVGAITSGMTPLDRRDSYQCDITYGTAREFGFDFLRDRLRLRDELGVVDAEPPPSVAARLLQRPPAYVLVDEADSVLIDEARTPLILSGPSAESSRGDVGAFRWAAAAATEFQPQRDFIAADPAQSESGPVWLTAAGRERVRSTPMPRELDAFRLPELYEFIERAIRVARDFHRDRQYVVLDGKVVIVDEQTGRPGFGRQWPDGLHQAVEAREGLALTPQVETLARITLQDYFARFPRLAGLTGTALPAAREFRTAYQLTVVALPTHHACRREVLPPRLFATRAAKQAALVERIAKVHPTGRPVLVGTRTIGDSRALSEAFTTRGIAHRVLNATQLADEAEIVSQAGQRGQVTIATNMAGRGTDIRLGPGVRELGGLLVIGTELHESARVDAQLAGRCARQGDPGTVEQWAAIEDALAATAWGPRAAERMRQRAVRSADPQTGELPNAVRWFRWLRQAQARVEAQQAHDRTRLRRAESARRDRAQTLGQSIYAE